MTSTSAERTRAPWLPPRWFIRAAWVTHRAIYRFTAGRRGLAEPTPGGRFGYLRLTTVGRRSGVERAAILGYIEDGPNLVSIAMNGWADTDPAWWLNLQARPEARVHLKRGARAVRARAAAGECAARTPAVPDRLHVRRPRAEDSAWPHRCRSAATARCLPHF